MSTAFTVDVVTTEVSPGITQSTFDIIHSLEYIMHLLDKSVNLSKFK